MVEEKNDLADLANLANVYQDCQKAVFQMKLMCQGSDSVIKSWPPNRGPC